MGTVHSPVCLCHGRLSGTQVPAPGAALKIYMADSDNYRIVRIDDMTGAGWTAFGSSGKGRGQFDFLQGDLCPLTA